MRCPLHINLNKNYLAVAEEAGLYAHTPAGITRRPVPASIPNGKPILLKLH
jgi:hypothetical protein